jgi:hypothetical protein
MADASFVAVPFLLVVAPEAFPTALKILNFFF